MAFEDLKHHQLSLIEPVDHDVALMSKGKKRGVQTA
jgi:hypothetical protein